MKVGDFIGYVASLPDEAERVHGHGYLLNLYMLAESLGAKRVLEFGFGWGYSAMAFAASLGNRAGTLISYDPVPREDPAPLIEFALRQGCTLDFRAAYVQDYDDDTPLDLVYVDGAVDRVCEDFNQLRSHVRPGGLIVIDGLGDLHRKDYGQDVQSAQTIMLGNAGHLILPWRYCMHYQHGLHVVQEAA